MRVALRVSLAAALCVVPLLVSAQQAAPAPPPAGPAPAREMPRPEELEPGVNTTPEIPRATTTPAGPAGPAAAAGAAADAAPATAGGAGTAAAPDGSAAAAKSGSRAGKPQGKGPDRLELEATEITGNRELPKVLYIVPWKRSDLGDLVGKPVNSLLDEVLQPLDRDVFQRENRYYEGLKPGSATPKAGAAQGSGSHP